MRALGLSLRQDARRRGVLLGCFAVRDEPLALDVLPCQMTFIHYSCLISSR